MLLTYHFFSVAFYSIWVMFTHPHVVPAPPKHIANGNGYVNGNGHVDDLKPMRTTPRIHHYPALFIKSLSVVSLLRDPRRFFLPIFFFCAVLDSLRRLWSFASYGQKSGGGPRVTGQCGAIHCWYPLLVMLRTG